MLAFHHSPQLLSNVIMLRLFRANFNQLLGLPTCIVAAPLTEDDVPYHHLVVRRVDLEDISYVEIGIVAGNANLWTSMFIDHLKTAKSIFFITPICFFDSSAAASLAVLGPLVVDVLLELLNVGLHLLVFLLACQSSFLRLRTVRLIEVF